MLNKMGYEFYASSDSEAEAKRYAVQAAFDGAEVMLIHGEDDWSVYIKEKPARPTSDQETESK